MRTVIKLNSEVIPQTDNLMANLSYPLNWMERTITWKSLNSKNKFGLKIIKKTLTLIKIFIYL